MPPEGAHPIAYEKTRVTIGSVVDRRTRQISWVGRPPRAKTQLRNGMASVRENKELSLI